MHKLKNIKHKRKNTNEHHLLLRDLTSRNAFDSFICTGTCKEIYRNIPVIANSQKQPKYPSLCHRLNKLLLLCAVKWNNLQDAFVSGKSKVDYIQQPVLKI